MRSLSFAVAIGLWASAVSFAGPAGMQASPEQSEGQALSVVRWINTVQARLVREGGKAGDIAELWEYSAKHKMRVPPGLGPEVRNGVFGAYRVSLLISQDGGQYSVIVLPEAPCAKRYVSGHDGVILVAVPLGC